ncbi:MAG: hypothetical protein WA944_13365 [Mycobacterium sp.]
MELMVAAAARRELGGAGPDVERPGWLGGILDPDFGELSNVLGLEPSHPPVGSTGPGMLGTLIDQTINTLLGPVRTLLAELRGERLAGLPGQVPASYVGFPGACTPSGCTPSSDIPIPQPNSQITFLNLSGKSLKLTSLDTTYPLAYGPDDGYVLGHARQVEMGLYTSAFLPGALMEWTDGSATDYVVLVQGALGAQVAPAGNLQGDVFTTPQPVTGPVSPEGALRQTVVFLPPSGSEITIDESDGMGQAIVAMSLCGVAGSCNMEAIDSRIEYTDTKNVGNTVFNYGTVNSTNTYEMFHEAVKTNGFEANLKLALGGGLNFTLGPLTFQGELNAVLQGKYGRSWSSGVITKEGATLSVAPGKYGQILLSYPEYHDTVDMTLTQKNVTIHIPGTQWVSPVPEDATNPDGSPVALPSWVTRDYDIGTGPMPDPDAGEAPVAPDIATPAPSSPRSFGAILADFVVAEVRAVLSLPGVVFNSFGVFGATRGFEIVNLTPYTQYLTSISGDYDVDRSPPVGYELAPFQMVRVEVPYSLFGNDLKAYVQWHTNPTGSGAGSYATLSTVGTGNSYVDCTSLSCMNGGYDSALSASVMYLIAQSPRTIDLTRDPNTASAAINAACETDSAGRSPSTCAANVTGQEYYTNPVAAPQQGGYHWNDSSQPATFSYTLVTYESTKESWSVGGGLKIKEKSGLFLVQQMELEATALYSASKQTKESESTTVKQSVPPYSTGVMSKGDSILRTYGDFVVSLPNLTLVVRDNWIENPAGLAALGPVVSLTDYPGSPSTNTSD